LLSFAELAHGVAHRLAGNPDHTAEELIQLQDKVSKTISLAH